ncbi:MAG: zeta toxin family protein [Christensenellaceae bacterium]
MSSIKTFTIYAGVNGAGKSTLFEIDKPNERGVRLNSDEIVKDSGQDWRDDKAQLEAGKEVLRRQEECFKNGLSFNRETTLSGHNIVKTVERAHRLKYKICLMYVGVESPQIAQERVKKRVEQGGHGVSKDTIERRFSNSKENLFKIIPYCDEVILYDNSGTTFQDVASIVGKEITRTPHPCLWCDKLLNEFKVYQKEDALKRYLEKDNK